MKSFRPMLTPNSSASQLITYPTLSIPPIKCPRNKMILSKALLPSRERVTKSRAVSHTLKLDFSNLHSCSELSKLNLLCAHQHIKNIPHSFSKSSVLYELSIIIQSDRWQLNYKKSLIKLFQVLPKLKNISKLNISFDNTVALDRQLLYYIKTALRHLRKLKTCNIRIHWCPNFTYEMLPELLNPLRYRSMKETTLSFWGDSSSVTRRVKPGLKLLSKALAKFIQCRSLGLELDFDKSLTDRDIFELASYLKRIAGLQSLKFKLGGQYGLNHIINTASDISDIGLLNFLEILHKFTQLFELSIHFKNCKKISEQGLLDCMSLYFKPDNFKILNYKFEGYSMQNPQKILAIIDPLSQNQDLKDIKLRVQSSPDFMARYSKLDDFKGTKNQFKQLPGKISLSCDIPPALSSNEYHLYAQSFSSLPNIHAFNFNCRGNAYTWELSKKTFLPSKDSPITVVNHTNDLLHLSVTTDESIKESQASCLMHLLKSLPHVQALSLNLLLCSGISEQTLIDIMALLPSIQHLKYLALHFKKCLRVTDPVMLAMTNTMIKYQTLEHLSLHFDECKVLTNEAILFLCTGLKELLLLKNLNLDFQECLTLTSQSLETLPSSLLYLLELEGLSLVFPGIHNTSNTELEKFGMNISGLKQLRNVKFDFSNCGEISDRGLHMIGESVMKIGGVKYLEILLDNCYQLGNEGICQVGRYIKTLKDLQSLKMSLKGCSNITAEGVNELLSHVCEIKNLKYLTLDFGSGESMHEEIFHKADVFLKFEGLENISVNLKASREIITERVDFRKKLGEVRQVILFFK